MWIEKNLMCKIKRHSLYFLLSFIVFFLLNLPLKGIQLVEGYADLRISAIFPVVAGLMLGPAGAVGCGFGNLCADLFGTFNEGSIFGFFANIVSAYLPYKLWHTLFPIKNHKLTYLSSANSLLKYLFVTTFSVVVAMSIIASGCELIGILSYDYFLQATILCNLTFAIFGNAIIFLVLEEVFHISPYVPQKVYQYRYEHKKYRIDYILCGLFIILQSITFLVAKFQGSTNNSLVDGFCIALLIVIAAVVLLPMNRSREKVVNQPIKYIYKKGLQRQLLLGFFLFSVINIIFYCSTIIILIFGYYEAFEHSISLVEAWIAIFEYNAIGNIIFLFALFAILRWTEKQVIEPLTSIADYSRRFVKDGLLCDKIELKNSENEITQLAESIETMSSDIVSYVEKQHQQAKKEEGMKALFKAARNIQMGILPEPLDKELPFKVSAYIKPAMDVGGDFYDFIKLSDDKLLICIADVSSSGLPAAMFMSQASVLVKCFKAFSPDEILNRINDALYENNSENMFVTMFVGVLDIKKSVFEFSNAGHNYPIIWNGENMQWLKTDPNLILGMLPKIKYDLHSIKIDDFFEIFMYTDGVNEAENVSKEFYGNQRLENACKSLNVFEDSVEVQLEKIGSNLKEFTNNASQSDDITMMFMKCKNKKK